MPPINAVEAGRQAFQEEVARDLDIEAGRRREVGINALADEFGDVALNPQAFSTVSGAVQREAASESVIGERDRRATRADIEDKQDDAELARAAKFRTAKNVVGALKLARDKNIPMEDAVSSLSSVIRSLGGSEEEIGNLPANISADPNFLDLMDGAIRAEEKKGRGVFLKKSEGVTLADGTKGIMRTFSDGSTDIIRGATLRKDELSAERIAQKVPEFQGAVAKAKVVGKGQGKIDVRELPKGPKANATARLVLEGAQQRALFLDAQIGTAINLATNYWTTGIGSLQDIIAGGKANDLKATLDTIGGIIGLGELERLRTNSTSGASGLGQLSERELVLLQSLWGSLMASQSEEQFLTNMENLRTGQREVFARIAAQYKIDYGAAYAGQGAPLDMPLVNDERSQRARALVNKHRTKKAQ